MTDFIIDQSYLIEDQQDFVNLPSSNYLTSILNNLRNDASKEVRVFTPTHFNAAENEDTRNFAVNENEYFLYGNKYYKKESITADYSTTTDPWINLAKFMNESKDTDEFQEQIKRPALVNDLEVMNVDYMNKFIAMAFRRVNMNDVIKNGNNFVENLTLNNVLLDRDNFDNYQRFWQHIITEFTTNDIDFETYASPCLVSFLFTQQSLQNQLRERRVIVDDRLKFTNLILDNIGDKNLINKQGSVTNTFPSKNIAIIDHTLYNQRKSLDDILLYARSRDVVVVLTPFNLGSNMKDLYLLFQNRGQIISPSFVREFVQDSRPPEETGEPQREYQYVDDRTDGPQMGTLFTQAPTEVDVEKPTDPNVVMDIDINAMLANPLNYYLFEYYSNSNEQFRENLLRTYGTTRNQYDEPLLFVIFVEALQSIEKTTSFRQLADTFNGEIINMFKNQDESQENPGRLLFLRILNQILESPGTDILEYNLIPLIDFFLRYEDASREAMLYNNGVFNLDDIRAYGSFSVEHKVLNKYKVFIRLIPKQKVSDFMRVASDDLLKDVLQYIDANTKPFLMNLLDGDNELLNRVDQILLDIQRTGADKKEPVIEQVQELEASVQETPAESAKPPGDYYYFKRNTHVNDVGYFCVKVSDEYFKLVSVVKRYNPRQIEDKRTGILYDSMNEVPRNSIFAYLEERGIEQSESQILSNMKHVSEKSTYYGKHLYYVKSNGENIILSNFDNKTGRIGDIDVYGKYDLFIYKMDPNSKPQLEPDDSYEKIEKSRFKIFIDYLSEMEKSDVKNPIVKLNKKLTGSGIKPKRRSRKLIGGAEGDPQPQEPPQEPLQELEPEPPQELEPLPISQPPSITTAEAMNIIDAISQPSQSYGTIYQAADPDNPSQSLQTPSISLSDLQSYTTPPLPRPPSNFGRQVPAFTPEDQSLYEKAFELFNKTTLTKFMTLQAVRGVSSYVYIIN